MLLILSHPRSGTKFTSVYLGQMGADVPHERIGRDGAIGWMYAAENRYGPKHGRRQDHKWDVVLQQVREPIKVIASMETHMEHMWKWIAKELGYLSDDKLKRRMEFYLAWHEKIKRLSDDFYRVEDLYYRGEADTIFRYVLRDVIGDRYSPAPNNKTNTRQHSDLTWDDLYRCDKEMADSIKHISLEYGYES